MSAPKPDLESLYAEIPDPELKGTLERLGAVIAKREPEPERKAVAKVIQLPLWPEAKRGVPNDILRSALFAAIQGKGREYVKQHMIAAYDGVKIKYTGEQLDQSDLDVWEQILHLGPPGANDRFFTVRRNSGRISSCLPYRTAFKNKKIRETAPERVGIRWDIS
jgi:hypothetical protein